MYIYFDRNGTIKEVINDESIRKGSNDYNKIYCYLEGNPDIDDIWYLQKNPDGTLTNEVSFVDNIVTKSIPYDSKRDMKYFKDFEEYKFYVFNLSSSYLSQNGLVVSTIRVAENNTLWALGELTFNVQANIVNSDNDITQSQYDYLLSIVNKGITFIPSVSSEGIISWTNTSNLPNPDPVNIKGERGYSVSQTRQTQTSEVSDGVNIVEFVSENGTVIGNVQIRNGSRGEKGTDAINATYFEIDKNGHLIMYYSNGSSPDIYLVSDDENSDSYYVTLGVSSSLVGHLVFIYD